MSTSSVGGEVRTAEVIAALSLATDLAMALPLEHGLESTLIAMRLAERLGADRATATQTYYGCLLFHVGCTADAEQAAAHFEEDIHLHYTPVMFGSRREIVGALVRAVAPPGSGPAPVRAARLARRMPVVMRGHTTHLTAMCEVAEMLTQRIGMPADVRGLFGAASERWDGGGFPGRARGDEVPLAMRIVHVARDAAMQRLLHGPERAAEGVLAHAGGALDPDIARCLADHAAEILAGPPEEVSAWEATLLAEPGRPLVLAGEDIDRALAAVGDFADLVSPYLARHAGGVADTVGAAARAAGLPSAEAETARRAALVHDIGRVAVPPGIWQKAGRLTADEWERVRLHPYHTERILTRSPFLAGLAPAAGAHHERLDGSGYHRGAGASALGAAARLLQAADAFQAMTEPRAHRPPVGPAEAAEALGADVRAGRLDADAVAAVLDGAGQRVPRLERPAGLTEREVQVLALLARGLQTKQVAQRLGISVKTADRHVQNAYAKAGVSTRAAATLFVMQHGLVAWGELPIGREALQT